MQQPSKSTVPANRIVPVGTRPLRPAGQFVLYWMIANRRPGWNFSLQRALDWARELKRPLLVFEALRCDYPWACARLHQFVIEGMQANAAAFAGKATYFPYVEPEKGAARGLFRSLAKRSCVVVSDDFPCFFLPRMVAAAAESCPVRFELVDSNGLLPLRATDRPYPTAYAFRRFLQRELPRYLEELPQANPFRGVALAKPKPLPRELTQRWPRLAPSTLTGGRAAAARFVGRLPIDHSVPAVTLPGGFRRAQAAANTFLKSRLSDYDEMRNQPEQNASSGLAPYLHFGHLAAHEVFHRLAARVDWHPGLLAERASGSRSGWWGMAASEEAFLDQLITWRELGYNMCHHRADYDSYSALPEWALKTLGEHADDVRPDVYSLESFEAGQTHDELWNAAQAELVGQGRIHNYLRMLWGKKILEWTRSPREALEVMIELNNKYALDGRNPNSYSGIFWVLGRYDRAWGERPIFGKVRYMSSANTARKVRVRDYIKRHRMPSGD